MWDLAAKSVDLPLYQLLGAHRHRIEAYASGLAQPIGPTRPRPARARQGAGMHGYKLHTFGVPARDIDACRAMRAAVGDDFALILDPVNSYDRQGALRVGRVLDELGFEWFEAPLPDDDVEGYVELCRTLDVPIANGEVRVRGLRDYAELVRQGAVDIVRVAADVQGGLTMLRKAGALAEASSRRLEPRCYGTTLVQAAHLHWASAWPTAGSSKCPNPRAGSTSAWRRRSNPTPTATSRAGPERPFEREAGPERPFEREAGPERPFEREAGPERPFEREPAPGLGIAIDWDAVDNATTVLVT